MKWWSGTNVESWSQPSEREVEVVINSKCELQTQLVFTISEDSTSPSSQLDFGLSLKGHYPKGVNRLGMGFGAASEDEDWFGFGERFDTTSQRGLARYVYVEDGGWSLNHFDPLRLPKGPQLTYVPMPWLISSVGYGLYLNTTFRSNWDLDSPVFVEEDQDPLNGFRFEVESDSPLLFHLFLGPSTKDVISQYTQFTGRSLIPPLFQFGPWNQFSNEFDSTSLEDALVQYVDWDIPISVSIDGIHFFPKGSQRGDPEKYIQRNLFSKSYGVKTTAYFNSMLDTGYYPKYNECVALDLFVKNEDDSVYKFIYKGAARAPFYASLLDFTNPSAVKWYQNQFQHAVDMGFDGWMYDYGEYLSQSTVSYDGRSGHEVHNEYPLLYQRTAFDYFMGLDEDPTDDYAPPFVYYVRSGYAGSGQVIWNHWTGDPMCDWSENSGIKAQVKAQLNIGLGGVPFSGSDIGGFVWTIPPSEELWMRWSQLGAFSGTMHTQTGGTSMFGIPKTHINDSKRGTFIWRKLAKLRMSLLPYIYNAAHQARFLGLPIMRQHVLDFPSDVIARNKDLQFMFGDSFLIAPVLDEGATEWDVYLPNNQKWIDVSSYLAYDASDGRHRIGYAPSLEGGVDVKVDAPLETIPIFVREGSIVFLYDPTLDTVNKASRKELVTLDDVSHVIHGWIWPKEEVFEAEGSLYDGLSVSMSSTTSSEDEESIKLILKIQDEDLQRLVILQIALPPSLISQTSNPIVQYTSEDIQDTFQQVDNYREITRLNKFEQDDLSSSFSLDGEQSVLWVRMDMNQFEEGGSAEVEISF